MLNAPYPHADNNSEEAAEKALHKARRLGKNLYIIIEPAFRAGMDSMAFLNLISVIAAGKPQEYQEVMQFCEKYL